MGLLPVRTAAFGLALEGLHLLVELVQLVQAVDGYRRAEPRRVRVGHLEAAMSGQKVGADAEHCVLQTVFVCG